MIARRWCDGIKDPEDGGQALDRANYHKGKQSRESVLNCKPPARHDPGDMRSDR